MSLERISGPWEGLYVVSYTTWFNGLYFGYAKLCHSLPHDVWAADAFLKLSTQGFTDELQALVVADLCGQAMVGRAREFADSNPHLRRVAKAPPVEPESA